MSKRYHTELASLNSIPLNKIEELAAEIEKESSFSFEKLKAVVMDFKREIELFADQLNNEEHKLENFGSTIKVFANEYTSDLVVNFCSIIVRITKLFP